MRRALCLFLPVTAPPPPWSQGQCPSGLGVTKVLSAVITERLLSVVQLASAWRCFSLTLKTGTPPRQTEPVRLHQPLSACRGHVLSQGSAEWVTLDPGLAQRREGRGVRVARTRPVECSTDTDRPGQALAQPGFRLQGIRSICQGQCLRTLLLVKLGCCSPGGRAQGCCSTLQGRGQTPRRIVWLTMLALPRLENPALEGKV